MNTFGVEYIWGRSIHGKYYLYTSNLVDFILVGIFKCWYEYRYCSNDYQSFVNFGLIDPISKIKFSWQLHMEFLLWNWYEFRYCSSHYLSFVNFLWISVLTYKTKNLKYLYLLVTVEHVIIALKVNIKFVMWFPSVSYFSIWCMTTGL